VAVIPDVFTPAISRKIKIGPRSLNVALYSDDNGYFDVAARVIDEEIYAYIDDRFFYQDMEVFLSTVKHYLD